MVAGACHKKADYTIGDNWTPQYMGENSAWREKVEPLVWEWALSCELRGLPFTWNRCAWLSSICLDRDGDCFCVLTTDPDSGLPAFQFLEAHRIGSPWGVETVPEGPYKGGTMLNGVAYDQFMRPVGYNLLPENWNNSSKAAYHWLPADSVIHIFDPRWFSQGRGIPAISYGILNWYDMAEICDAEKIAVKVNSTLALIEKNETGRSDRTTNNIVKNSSYWDPKGVEPQVELLDSGLIRYIKTNGEIVSHTSDRPSQTWTGFMDYMARSAFSGADWPIEVAWNMATVGGAAVRAVVNQAQRSVNSRQAVLRAPFVNALLYAIGNMINAGQIPFVEDWFAWTFTTPAKFSVDVGRDRQNMREDLAAGIITLSQVVTDSGGDPESHMRRRAKDYQMAEVIAKEEGVPIDVVYNPLASIQLSNQAAFNQQDNGSDPGDSQDNQDSQDTLEPSQDSTAE